MSIRLKITILTDKKSYMNQYNIILSKKLQSLGHEVYLINSKNDLKQGDITFLFSCFELVKEDKLALNKHNIVIHESDLPHGKGWSPASWQILEGINKITLTAFEAVLSFDAGDIYFKDVIELDGTELADTWRRKIALKKIEMCLKIIDNYENLTTYPQSGEENFYKKRTAEDCKLEINKTIKEQFNLLRIVDNELYPAFFIYNNKKYILKILEAEKEY